MASHPIRNQLRQLLDGFGTTTSFEGTKKLAHQAKALVETHCAKAYGVEPSGLEAAAANNPGILHRETENAFGFKVEEQPEYRDVDDFAWQFSQRYTTLDDVTLPDNARFFDSSRRKLSREAVIKQMEQGHHHLFDIALSNEYVLLGENESFGVADMERKFSTNNEHLPPQSQSKREGNTKIFRSDPRAIIISYAETNGARGHLQVVFHDEHGKPIETVAMVRRPGEEKSEMTRQILGGDDFTTSRDRYPIGPEDAPYYAYALALTHFASGFTDQADKFWFDTKQAEEVVTMLRILEEKGIDGQLEPVLRDVLSDAKQLGGTINPAALMPGVYAEALQTEIDQGKFHGAPTRKKPANESGQGFAARLGDKPAASHVEQSRRSEGERQIG
ncbi:MAG: hypothetical protein ACPG80_01470 [Rickettsiales bacterium]